MSPLLPLLQPYPFQRLRLLLHGVTPNVACTCVRLGIGEPKHATPSFSQQALCDMAENELAFTRDLYANYNVTVLPGPFLVREAQGSNSGTGRICMALVADIAECPEAAHRIHSFVPEWRSWNASSSLHTNVCNPYSRDQSHDPTTANHSARRQGRSRLLISSHHRQTCGRANPRQNQFERLAA